jgi:trehalose-6-phosphatase
MTQVQRIMQLYADNMDGAFIEQRQSCILFNYKNAETEHGNLFIHDLYSLIEKALVGRNTEINYGSGYLEVKP